MMKTAPLTEQRSEQREKRTERWRSLAVAGAALGMLIALAGIQKQSAPS
jgi:hypothetical protein